MSVIDYIALGQRIRAARKEQHRTQNKLAKDAGISLSFLGHIERGARKASIETLVCIALALGTTPDALLCDSMDLVKKTRAEERAEIFASIHSAIHRLERTDC